MEWLAEVDKNGSWEALNGGDGSSQAHNAQHAWLTFLKRILFLVF